MTTKQSQRPSTGADTGNSSTTSTSGDTNKKPAHQRSNSRNVNRRSNANDNNGVNGFNFDDEEFQNNAKNRLLYLLINSIGSKIIIHLNSGSKISGYLENIDPSSLKIFIKLDNELKTINYEDLIDFELLNVDLFNNSYINTPAAKTSFKTDTDISNNNNSSGNNQSTRREEIERWVPEDSSQNAISLDNLTLEDSNPNWDQFQTNQDKFGIVSEFDEHLYTTRIDKSDPNYKLKLSKAEKLASEIENQSFNGNAHLAEERGLKFDDSGLDEEDKYSGVTREVSKSDALFESLINKDSKNFNFNSQSGEVDGKKYIPPSQRSRIQNIDSSIVSASKVEKKPTLELGKPPSTIPPKPSIPAKPVAAKDSTSTTPSTVGKVAAAAPAAAPQVTKKALSKDQLKKNSARNEIESLKEFSQTFKIPSKFPTDLLPIITKDKHKQEEIIKKLESEKTQSPVEILSATSVTSEKTAIPSAVTNVTTAKSLTPASTPTLPKPTPKTSFKLNPKAASFTPGGGSNASPLPNVVTPNFSKDSPRLAHTTYKNKRSYTVSPSSFFPPSKLPNPSQPRKLNEDFNFFKGCLKAYKNRESTSQDEFRLEKPFTTPPTWTIQQSDDFVKPYTSLFPNLDHLKFQQSNPSLLPQQIIPPQQRFIPPPQQHQQQQPIYHQPIQQFQPVPLNASQQFYYPNGNNQPFVQVQLSPQASAPQIHNEHHGNHQSPQFYQQRLNPYPPGAPQVQAQGQAPYNQRFYTPNNGYIPVYNNVPNQRNNGYNKNH